MSVTDPLGLDSVGGTGPGRPPDPGKVDLDTLVSIDDARHIQVHDLKGKATSINSFLLYKYIDGLIGEVDEVKKLFSGDLQIKTKNGKQTHALINLKEFCGRNVNITAPFWWNTCQGIVYFDGLSTMTSEEIINGLESIPGNPKIAMVKHFTRQDAGRTVNLNLAIFTFATKTLPDELKFGYQNSKVRLYIPNPRRCFICQEFGHGKSKCPNTDKAVCANCDSNDHERDACPENAVPKCHNCKLEHPSWSKDCAIFKHEKDICEYKVSNDVFFGAARIAVDKRVSDSYAAKAAAAAKVAAATATATPAKPVMENCETQTPLTFPPMPDLFNIPIMDAKLAAVYRALPWQMLDYTKAGIYRKVTDVDISDKPAQSSASTDMDFEVISEATPIVEVHQEMDDSQPIKKIKVNKNSSKSTSNQKSEPKVEFRVVRTGSRQGSRSGASNRPSLEEVINEKGWIKDKGKGRKSGRRSPKRNQNGY